MAWRRAETVASAALHGAVMAAVGDATHFQTARAGPFAGLLKVAQVGAHVFYRVSTHSYASAIAHAAAAPAVAAANGRVRVEFASFRIAQASAAPDKPADAPVAIQAAVAVPTPVHQPVAPILAKGAPAAAVSADARKAADPAKVETGAATSPALTQS